MSDEVVKIQTIESELHNLSPSFSSRYFKSSVGMYVKI